MDSKVSPAASAAKKLEQFYKTLEPKEQDVISGMVRASLVQAAEASMRSKAAEKVPDFVQGITGEHAPTLVKSLRFPGSLAAHSIPGCNASALNAIGEMSRSTKK